MVASQKRADSLLPGEVAGGSDVKAGHDQVGLPVPRLEDRRQKGKTDRRSLSSGKVSEEMISWGNPSLECSGKNDSSDYWVG